MLHKKWQGVKMTPSGILGQYKSGHSSVKNRTIKATVAAFVDKILMEKVLKL